MTNSYCLNCKGLIALGFGELVLNPGLKAKKVSVESLLFGLCLKCFKKKGF